jgi:hypothetical protein
LALEGLALASMVGWTELLWPEVLERQVELESELEVSQVVLLLRLELEQQPSAACLAYLVPELVVEREVVLATVHQEVFVYLVPAVLVELQVAMVVVVCQERAGLEALMVVVASVLAMLAVPLVVPSDFRCLAAQW